MGGGSEPFSTGLVLWQLLKFALAFSLVVGLAYLTARVLGRRWTPARNRDGFSVLGAIPLGGRRSLLVVRVGRRALILGLGEQEVRLLDSISDPDELAALGIGGKQDGGQPGGFRQAQLGPFAERLRQALTRRGGTPHD